MHSSSVSKSSSAISTGTTRSEDSQSGAAAGLRQHDSFVGLSTTDHTPESTLIPVTSYRQQDELGLLSEIGTTQIVPFEALTTHLAVTFDDDDQGQSASSLSLSNEPSRSQKSSQPVDDIVPIVREGQSPYPTDKWIVMIGDDKKPFKCGFKGCGRKYSQKESLRTHFVTHTGDSKLRCHLGDCAGIVIYPDTRALTRHIQKNHTFERPFRCELCDWRFKLKHHLKNHREHVHFIKRKKKSSKSRSFSKLSSAATTTVTATAGTCTINAEQRQQGSFLDLSKTVHTPEPTLIPATYYQQDEPRLLSGNSVSDISSSQIDPFGILATHQTVTFEDLDQVQEQEQPDEFPLPFDELLNPLNDFDPMASEDPDDVNLSILPNKNDKRISNRTTISIPEHEILPPNNDHFWQALTGIEPEAVGITGEPKLPSCQHQAYQRPETDKWIIVTGDKKRPFKCGYEGCDKSYTRKSNLRAHFVKHTSESFCKCYLGECNGRIVFRKQQELTRHIRFEHKFERSHQCEVCGWRFIRSNDLMDHRKKLHSVENEQTSPKRKKK